jgi:hypothetical protein
MEIDINRNMTRRLEVIGGDLVSALDDANFNGLYKHGLGLRTIIQKRKPWFQSPVADRDFTLDAFSRLVKFIGSQDASMNFSGAKNETLQAFYLSVQRQVDADNQSGGRYRSVGESTKQYASKLREEMDRRRLRFIPIDWPHNR